MSEKTSSFFRQRWFVALLLVSLSLNGIFWWHIRHPRVVAPVGVNNPAGQDFVCGQLYMMDSIVIQYDHPTYFYCHELDNRQWFVNMRLSLDWATHRALVKGDPVDSCGSVTFRR